MIKYLARCSLGLGVPRRARLFVVHFHKVLNPPPMPCQVDEAGARGMLAATQTAKYWARDSPDNG
jgi:hypothetical protein